MNSSDQIYFSFCYSMTINLSIIIMYVFTTIIMPVPWWQFCTRLRYSLVKIHLYQMTIVQRVCDHFFFLVAQITGEIYTSKLIYHRKKNNFNSRNNFSTGRFFQLFQGGVLNKNFILWIVWASQGLFLKRDSVD